MSAGEFEYIRWLRNRTPTDQRVLVGPGDDCAVLAPPVRPILVTTDVLTEGVDFILAESGGRAIGRKAMAVNLSDIAAMAGVPMAAVVGVVLPTVASRDRQEAAEPDQPLPGGRGSLAEDLYLGLREVADAFGVALVGGDTNSWDGGLVISVTVLGEATERGPVLRSGAKPGDWLFVTGPLGGSLRGRHLSPTPRVREALALHRFADLHAMADISDGLSADLNHILEESGCGAVLHADAIPIHADAVELARMSGRTPLVHALGDGEDFELVFAVSPADGEWLSNVLPLPNLTKVGECVERGLWLERGGTRMPLEPKGWVHAIG